MNNWQKLCEVVTPLLRGNIDEDLFHQIFEAQLKTVFGWGGEEIRHKQPVPMGRDIKEADTVLLDGGVSAVVLEMKRPNVILGDKEIGQLTSYMRILGVRFGLLIGDEIRVFYDDDSNNDEPTQVARIPFDASNADGVSLGEILAREAFSVEKLKEYCVERIKRILTRKKMEELRDDLLANDGEKIRQILVEKLKSDGFEEKHIRGTVLGDIVISKKETPAFSPSMAKTQPVTTVAQKRGFIAPVKGCLRASRGIGRGGPRITKAPSTNSARLFDGFENDEDVTVKFKFSTNQVLVIHGKGEDRPVFQKSPSIPFYSIPKDMTEQIRQHFGITDGAWRIALTPDGNNIYKMTVEK